MTGWKAVSSSGKKLTYERGDASVYLEWSEVPSRTTPEEVLRGILEGYDRVYAGVRTKTLEDGITVIEHALPAEKKRLVTTAVPERGRLILAVCCASEANFAESKTAYDRLVASVIASHR
jgi:hypothetical protein